MVIEDGTHGVPGLVIVTPVGDMELAPGNQEGLSNLVITVVPCINNTCVEVIPNRLM
jgi:hypothetical protein